MTSKKSFFDYLKNQMKQRFWMFLFASLGYFAFIAMPAIYMVLEDETTHVYDMFLFTSFFITTAFAIFNASNIFSYVFSKTEFIFYHSLPVNREKLYLEKQLGGFLWFFFAFLINFVLIYLISAGSVEVIKGQLLSILIKNIITYLIINNSVIFAILISNSLFNAALNMLILFVLPMLAYYTMLSYEMRYSINRVFELIMDFKVLSPVYTAFILHFPNKWVMHIYQYHIGAIVFFVVFLYVINYFLFKHRKSESSELTRVYRVITTIFKILTGVFLALFIALVSNSSHSYIYMILSLITVYAIFEILTSFDIKMIWKNKYIFVISVVLCISAMFMAENNFFNIKFKLPDVKMIQELRVSSIKNFRKLPLGGNLIFNQIYYGGDLDSNSEDISYEWHSRGMHRKEVKKHFSDNMELKYAFLKEVLASSTQIYDRFYYTEKNGLFTEKIDQATDQELGKDELMFEVRLQLKNNKSAEVNYKCKVKEIEKIYQKYLSLEKVKKMIQYDGMLKLAEVPYISMSIYPDFWSAEKGSDLRLEAQELKEFLDIYLFEAQEYLPQVLYDDEEIYGLFDNGYTMSVLINFYYTQKDEIDLRYTSTYLANVRIYFDERFTKTIAFLQELDKEEPFIRAE